MIGFRFIIILLLLYVDIKIANAQEISAFNYPKDNTCDTFFNKSVADPMRWLENLKSANTTEWLVYEENIWKEYKKELRRDIGFINTEINQFSIYKYNIPIKKGKYYFKILLDDNTSPPSLYFSGNEDFSNKIKLFSPIDISTKDKIIISDYEISPDSKYVAISFSRNGADVKEIIVVTIKNRKILDDHIYNSSYSNIVWVKNGFLYTTYFIGEKFGAINNPIVYYHTLNTHQDNDLVVFKREVNKFRQYDYSVSNDDSTIILREGNESKGEFSLFLINITNGKAILKPAIMNMSLKYQFNIISCHNDSVIAYTNYDNPKGSVICLNLSEPSKWVTMISQFNDALLTKAKLIDDSTFLCVYRVNAISDMLAKVNTEGEIIQVAFIEKGFTINKITKIDENNYFVGANFPVLPTIVYNLRIKDFKLEVINQTVINFDLKNIQFSIEKYKVDSVEVPLLIIRNKNIKLDGNNPLILESYGGFGALTNHNYDPGLIHFLKEGGVYAYAYVRGGGDFGRDWGAAGRRLNKINTINDFIDAAEYLINKKYTNANKIAITGASHGGMLVAAAMIKRPDLFKVVIPKMGIYDMIRWEEFTVGKFHLDEFGTTKNENDFLNLLSYSPYHNIDTTINYPATLLICGDNDERTTPFQTYKFAARLRNNPAQKNPILLKVIKKAGHYGSSNFDGYVNDLSEEYGFILNQLKQP